MALDNALVIKKFVIQVCGFLR